MVAQSCIKNNGSSPYTFLFNLHNIILNQKMLYSLYYLQKLSIKPMPNERKYEM
jgi:hypothetical protein